MEKEPWIERSLTHADASFADKLNAEHTVISNTHTFKRTSFHWGIETLQVSTKIAKADSEYEIYCADERSGAMNILTTASRIKAKPERNFIFWNYPGVAALAILATQLGNQAHLRS